MDGIHLKFKLVLHCLNIYLGFILYHLSKIFVLKLNLNYLVPTILERRNMRFV